MSHVSKGFNSASHVQNRVHDFGMIVEKTLNSLIPIEKKSSISRVTKVFNSWSLKNLQQGSILWVFFWKKILWVLLWRGLNFFESHSTMCLKKKFNPWVKFNSLSHVEKETFNSWSHIPKKKVQFCESCSKKVQFLETYWKKVQLFASHWKEGSFFLSHVNKKVQFCESCKKGSILSVVFN